MGGRSGRRRWLRLCLQAVLLLFSALFGWAVWVSYQEAQVYLHPARGAASGELLKAAHISYRDIALHTRDGLSLSAWYVPPQNGAVILLAHGYGSVRPEEMAVLFASRGFGVVAWDFRAHGQSAGGLSTLGYYEQLDVEAALDYALAQPAVKHVGAWGGSMGAAAVILTAARRGEIEAVVSDSAFPALEDVLRLNSPLPVFRPLIRFFLETATGVSVDDVRPVDAIGRISPRPVFIVDGWQGGTLAMNSPYRLYAAAGAPRQLWVENGVPHLQMYAHDPGQYTQKVVGFFEQYLLGR